MKAFRLFTLSSILVLLITWVAVGQPTPPLIVQEQDGTPSGVAIRLKFDNGTVTKTGTTFDIANTGAAGACSGTTTYLDGEGNCDTLDGLEDFETATDDGVVVGNGTTFDTKAIADCDDSGGNHLNYDTTTNAFSCGTSSSITDTFSSIEEDGVGISTNAPTLDFDGTDFTLTESPTDNFDVTIDDDGHLHTGASISGIDISDDTNLTCGTNCTLTGDDISVDDAFLVNNADDSTSGRVTMEGLTTNQEILVDGSQGHAVGGQNTDTPDTTPDGQLYLGGVHNGGYNTGGASNVKLYIDGYDNEGNVDIIRAVDENDEVDFQIVSKGVGGNAELGILGRLGVGDLTPDFTLEVASGTVGFGSTDSVEITNGTGPTVDAAGEIAVDTTDDQLVYYGAAKRVIPYEKTVCMTIEDLAADDDDVMFYAPQDNVTLIKAICHCALGTCTTEADISFEHLEIGTTTVNSVTGTVNCEDTTTGDSATTLSGDTTVDGLDIIRFDVDNSVDPETDNYQICLVFTVDSQ